MEEEWGRVRDSTDDKTRHRGQTGHRPLIDSWMTDGWTVDRWTRHNRRTSCFVVRKRGKEPYEKERLIQGLGSSDVSESTEGRRTKTSVFVQKKDF